MRPPPLPLLPLQLLPLYGFMSRARNNAENNGAKKLGMDMVG